MNMQQKCPLVSVLIPNYNYGRYLPNCLDSILAQTYPNIEVIFVDNASTDDSFSIALSYCKKFADRGYYYKVDYNKRNVGSDRNTDIAIGQVLGDYFYVLASDDAIEPTFVERCVDVFERYTSVGMVMTHRKEMDDDGNIYETEPFYNTSCVVPGDEQAAVFMMAGIAIPGQRMMRTGRAKLIEKYKVLFQVAGDWFGNYLYTCTNDIAYIKEPLCRYRVHPGNETNESEKNLLGIFEHYRLIHHFCFIAKAFDQQEALERYDAAVEKLGHMCLRYATKFLQCDELVIARKYLDLAPVFWTGASMDNTYNELYDMLSMEQQERERILSQEKYTTQRTVSYDPPEGYIPV